MPTRKSSSNKKSSSKKSSAKKTTRAKKRTASTKSKRTLIEPRKGDRRFVRRGKKGEFTTKQVDAGRSLAADRRSKSKTKVPKGQGDRGETGKTGILAKIFG